MKRIKSIFSNVSIPPMFFTAVLSALLAFCLLLCTFQVSAWFKNFTAVTTPAELTNFIDEVQFSNDGGNTWNTLASGQAVSVTVHNGVLSPTKFKISHQGKSTAYLRFSLYSTFQNADTDTALPYRNDLLAVSFDTPSKWYTDAENGFWYYNEALASADFSEEAVLTELDTLTVSLDSNAFATVSQHQDYEGEIYIIVDSVQPDRYPVFWEIDQLPFAMS